jgi:hypothetical protein
MTRPDTTPSILDGLNETMFRRVLARMSSAEKQALYAAVVNTPPADPRERLLWHARKERQERFMARFRRLSVRDAGAAWLRLAAGDDLDAILDELPQTSASDDAGNPIEGKR